MAALWVLIFVVILIAAYLYYAMGTAPAGLLPLCVRSHQPSGLNYPWLNDVHGGVQKITFEEPVGSGVWRDYTDKIWEIHCKVVKHDPGNLVRDHMRAFVDPETRFARLNFHFADGAVMEPTREFYEREAAWFRANMH